MPQVLAFLPSIIGAAGSFFGGRAANKASSSTAPTFAPEFSPLKNTILQMTQQRLMSDPNLAGYQAGGVQKINRVFGNTAQAQNNDLSARGLSTSPVAATVGATRENARAGQVAGFENQVPLLARDLQTQDLGLAGNVLGLGRGSTTTGQEGGGLAGGLTQLGKYLGYISSKGGFGGPTSPDATTPSAPGLGGGGINWGSIFGNGPGRNPYTWQSPALTTPNVGPYQPVGFQGWG